MKMTPLPYMCSTTLRASLKNGAGIGSYKSVSVVIKRKSKLTKSKIDRLMEHFVAGTTARTAACLLEINRNTTAKFYHSWREVIACNIELKESSSATKALPLGKNKSLAATKTARLSLYSGRETLQQEDLHYQLIKNSPEFLEKEPKMNDVKNFLSQSKRHLRKFNGVPKTHFYYFVKECEWRFNFGTPDKLLKTLKQWAKSVNKS